MASALTVETLNDKPIGSYDDLLSIFHAAIKPASEFRCGAEMEKPGVFADGRPVPYDGEPSVRAILEELTKKGWTPDGEYAGGPLIALLRNGASVTLEPGAQLELSGAPLVNAHQICSEFRSHLAEIAPYSQAHGITWLGLGFHPFAKREDFVMVPKPRYPIMRDYLPTRGSLALDMMLRTSTVQANYDYLSEADAMTKMRVALKLAPLTAAMFANSPFYEGAPFGGKSYRAKVWLDVDPDRSGLVPTLWKKTATFTDYVEWALDVPMFMFKRNGESVVNTGQSFRSFWKSGFSGHKPTLGDWKTHLNTLFPEVRLKNTIEVRAADAQGGKMACALPALWTGILYDAQALSAADAMTSDWTHDEISATRKQVWEKGLQTKLRATTYQSLAEKLIEIAEGGLERRDYKSPSGNDERVHLKRLKELVARGECPADRLLDGITNARDITAEIIARCDLGAG
ncbi:MAG: glutamate--cysteine ligase [Labilithrix sp.]|nr:glutamate--cysteine ligase [Labilithrix sp.]MCW5813741.1 glutamate--cysteine ligase [Labilithrix sp.]